MKKFYDYKRDGITQSILSKFLRCRQMGKLHLEGWERMGSDSYAMSFGNFIHECLAQLYGHGKQPTRHRIKLYCNRLKKQWGVKDLQMVEISKVLLIEYFRFYKDDFEKRWVQIEQEFKCRFIGHNGLLRGKRDAVFKIKGYHWLFETKTKSVIDEDGILALLPIDMQVMFYLYTLWKELKKMPKGVLYNVIRRPGLRRRQTEGLGAFCTRVRDDIRKYPEHYFKRFENIVVEADLLAFEKRLVSIVDDFIAWQEGRASTYMNTTACVDKYGLCQFVGICANDDYSEFKKRKQVHRELEVA